MAPLPQYPLRIRRENNKNQVWDIIRKKFIALTPEEFVRQNLVHYLIEEKKFPRGLISIEKQIIYNQLSRRYDVVIADRNGEPMICAECKAPDVVVDEKTLRQVMAYNSEIRARGIILTNGKQLYFFLRGSDGYRHIEEIPDFEKLLDHS